MLNARIISRLFAGALAVGVAGIGLVSAQNPPRFEPPPDQAADQGGDENYEALTRGPLHEAFANPYTSEPKPGLTIQKKPPEPIEEIPPETAPAGENVVWIPGYWGWGVDEEDFLWISGLWRNVPPDRRWVPGYWTEVQNGYQWISGFWTSTEANELSYLPEPPESLERGPNAAAPDGNYFWSPGCWVWADNDYQWRPGYWAQAHEGWVWVPDHYLWTPYGCVFVSGYWDRDFVHRGTLFSPVRFVNLVPNYRYVPRVTINPTVLLVHLFVNRPYHHYQFGDYYSAVNNSNYGITPWVSYGRRAGWYDPLLTYYRWSYARRGVDLTNRLAAWNQYYVQHEDLRPPRTFRAQRQFRSRFAGQDNVPLAQSVFARTLQDVVSSDQGRQRFRRVSNDVRQQLTQSTEQFQRLREQRADLEVARARQDAPREPGQEGRRARLERTLQLPQRVTALRPELPDTAQPQTPGQPGAEQPEGQERNQVPPPARPPKGTRPGQPGQQPGQRPEQRPERPEQPSQRPEQPGQRPEQPRQRPEQPSQRPEQPGQRNDRRARGGDESGQRIPPFNFRRDDRPRGEQPGRNPQQIDPRNRRGFDALPPGFQRPQQRPDQRPGARGQDRPRNPGQAGPPQQPRNPGQAGPPQRGGNPGQAGPPKRGGNPGQGGLPKDRGNRKRDR